MSAKTKKLGALKMPPVVGKSRLKKAGEFVAKKHPNLGWKASGWTAYGYDGEGGKDGHFFRIDVVRGDMPGGDHVLPDICESSRLDKALSGIAKILFPGLLGDNGLPAPVRIAEQNHGYDFTLMRPHSHLTFVTDERESPRETS